MARAVRPPAAATQGGYSLDNGTNVTPGFLGGTVDGATGGAGAGQAGRNGALSPAYGGAGVAHTAVPITGDFGVIGADGNPRVGYYGNMIGYGGGRSAGFDGVAMGAQYGESYGGGSGSEPKGVAGTPGFHTLGGGDGVIYIAYIPEPGTGGLILLGATAVLGLLRRKLHG